MKKIIIILLAGMLLLSGCQHQQSHVSDTITKHPVRIEKAEIREYKINIKRQQIYGQLYLPANKEAKLLPLVILCHGFGGDHTNMTPIARRLQEKGIAAYIFDFRGGSPQSKSDGSTSNMTIQSEMKDLRAIIKQMKKLDEVDNDQLYLAGHSQGGLVASLVANKREDIKGLFLAAPAFNIPEIARLVPLPAQGKTYRLWNMEAGCEYLEKARDIHIYDDIKDYDGQVYLFHGGSDTLVPLQYSADACQYYQHAKLYTYEEADHRFNNDLFIKMADICARYINAQRGHTN